ncbi:type I restriction enzyme, S subunit [Flavobacterium micromati]|uniref:Type I restriction enzyme, S subunit n=1 Tax=Flavobacterium micromati TaxID=229205 RepID=A0A1M5IC31_9FLAO|nr:restriction endonuclease subunit S [Flavobacterium micromati]SHG25785.1 type I restriction enzyme, S subunit [Flavobacterium micromati]
MEKLLPQLRFPAFKGEWESKKLGDLLEFKNGINATKEQYGRGVKFINVLDILNNDFITHEKIIGSVDVDQSLADKFSVNYGDILFQRSSETREEVGTACVYLDKDISATFGGFVIRGKKIGEYEPVFLNKLLKTDLSRDAMTSKSGGSTRYNIGQEILNSIKLNLPYLPEQTKIATFLTAVDEKLTALKQKKSLLEQYKKGVMQQIFSQELRFKDDTSTSLSTGSGNDFADWEEKKLGEICEIAKSGGTPTSTNKEYYNGDIPFLSISDMTSQGKYLYFTSNHISALGLKNSSSWLVPTDSIIYSMYASVGFVAINKVPLATSQAVLNLIFKSEVNLEFMYYTLIDFQKNIAQFITTGTQGNLNAHSVKGFLIQIPSLPEQTKIANFLTAIDEKINHCQGQIEKATIWKKGLLQQLFV